MQNEIQNKLNSIEQMYNVQILYACESGSRGWGFPSTDSDYDVRFIYSSPREEYLSIHDRKDTINIPVNEVLDISGWDIRKSLRLFYNSNTSLYEWLQSTIVYKRDTFFLDEIKSRMSQYFSFRKGLHHYVGMARSAFADLQGDEIKIKKYFYCLRPLLAARWIVDKQEVPPMDFDTLRTQIKDSGWQKAVDELLIIKSQATEKTVIKLVPVLSEFVREQMECCERQTFLPDNEEKETEPLNALFRNLIS